MKSRWATPDGLRAARRTPFLAPSLFAIPTAMLVRIVRMTFDPARVDDFLALFDATSPRIRTFDGCSHLELWQDPRHPNVLTTHSHWRDAEALDAYRHSSLFRDTWSRTKPYFVAPPRAWSHHVARSSERIEAGIRRP